MTSEVAENRLAIDNLWETCILYCQHLLFSAQLLPQCEPFMTAEGSHDFYLHYEWPLFRTEDLPPNASLEPQDNQSDEPQP